MFVVAVISCQRYAERRQWHRRTWCRDLTAADRRIVWFHVVGDATLDAPRYDPFEQLLTVPCADTYEALPQKVWWLFQHVHTCYGSRVAGLLKVDDDVIVNAALLVPFLERYRDTPYCGKLRVIRHRRRTHGRVGLVCDDARRGQLEREGTVLRPLTHCIGGAYYCSRAAVARVVRCRPTFMAADAFYEDYCVGMALRRFCTPTAAPLIAFSPRKTVPVLCDLTPQRPIVRFWQDYDVWYQYWRRKRA
jgi:hypothetical protein